MPQQHLCLLQLTCPLTFVVLRDEDREIARASLRVAPDQGWTLEQDVQLFTRLPLLKKGLLIWCGEDCTEILSVAWEKALRIIGVSGRIPAGTSLLDLLEAM
jgi:hypothetical protein